MTPTPAINDRDGRPVPLGPQLASGGEGAVFPLANDPKLVAKVYHRPPTDQTAEKLTAMIGLVNDRLLSMAAWPKELVYQGRTRQLAGFVMPIVADCQPIQHLYNPVQRLKFFPRKGWNFQVRAAMNLAAAFDEVHKAGCLVGDVNQSNVQVSSTALVHLRIEGKHYLCEVGVPLYTPPELQGKPFRGLVRSENHDRFGLAVLIYQLLFVGRHPYAGQYQGSDDPPFPDLIAQFRFAQGPLAHTWSMAPPPHTPTFADIPPEIGTLLRRSFERGSESGDRPRPADWQSALKRLESEVKTCSVDAGHKYWGGAKSCVWCRLAERGGPEYYFGVADGTASFAVDEAKLAEILKRLAAARPVDFAFETHRKRLTPAKPPRANPLPEEFHEYRSFAKILLLIAGLFVLAIPFGLFRGSIGLGGLLGSIVFGIWFLVDVLRTPWFREYLRRRRHLDEALAFLDDLEAEWGRILGQYRQDQGELGERIRRQVAECRGLASVYQVESHQLTAKAEAASRLRHLRLHLISDADIPKIGAGRKQALATHNINTAADIEEDAIRNIKGFGDALTSNLLTWRNEVLSRFRFDPKSAISPAETLSMTVRFRNHQKQILAGLDQQMTKLESLHPESQAAIELLLSKLKKAIADCEQAKVDLLFLERKPEVGDRDENPPGPKKRRPKR
jgi:DNA-binding helix-hairpin-helix protein with protein kinase domain